MAKKTFATKDEKLAYIIAHKAEIMRMKKAAVKYCNPFGVTIFEKNYSSTVKAAIPVVSYDSDDTGEIPVTVVANTYLFLDSHDDVHQPGIFAKSIQESQGSIFHLHDHIYQVDAKVGIPNKVYEQMVPWAQLGLDMEGSTTALLMDSTVMEMLNDTIYDQYCNKMITQHSVGMRYVNMFLCVNDPSYKDEYANWVNYSKGMGNLPKAIEQGYFWAITEAKLIEVSCVLKGSNELTGTLDNYDIGDDAPLDGDYAQGKKQNEPVIEEPPIGTQKKETTQVKYIYNPNLI